MCFTTVERQPEAKNVWHDGLFNCCSDMKSCECRPVFLSIIISIIKCKCRLTIVVLWTDCPYRLLGDVVLAIFPVLRTRPTWRVLWDRLLQSRRAAAAIALQGCARYQGECRCLDPGLLQRLYEMRLTWGDCNAPSIKPTRLYMQLSIPTVENQTGYLHFSNASAFK